MRGGRALLLSTLILAAMPPAGPGAARSIGGGPQAATFIDIHPWFVGDNWTYTTHAVTRAPDGSFTDSTVVLTTVVREVRTESVGGVSYSVYNATVSGTERATGQIAVPTLGLRAFDINGTSVGWSWTDRSDLAVVRTNESANGAGVVHAGGVFGDVPVTADGSTTITFLPAEEVFDFPLETGDAWAYNVTANTTGYAHVHANFILPYDNTTNLAGQGQDRQSLWFNGTEIVTVPAGTFGAARVHGSSPGAVSVDRWYNASVKNLVKSVSLTDSAPNNYVHVWTNLTTFSLAPVPWTGTISLNPRRVNPGGSVTASGLANANEDLALSVPVIGARFSVRSDAAGVWSATFAAPASDDNTPSNADVGSHGVIVEPATAASGWAVETVQLIEPDLFESASDLTFSGAPTVGVPLNLTAAVHAIAAVCVCSPFNVSFVVDGVRLQSFGLSWLGASASRSFNATWNPTPGWHTLEFSADSGGDIPERDETNNTATRRIFVGGPDLTPANLFLQADTNATYPDASAVGYASAPIQGRLGGVVNVTFDAANTGTADTIPPFTVAVLETQGLWGPPVGPRTFQASVSAPLAPSAHAGPWTASWLVPSRPGIFYLNVTVDTDHQVAESSESNNTFAVIVNVSGPDYVIPGVAAPAQVSAGRSIDVNVTVRNVGQLQADRTVTLAGYEGASSTPFAGVQVPPLGVGQSITIPIPWTAPNAAQAATLRFVVDPANVLEEMVESNNEATVAIEVRDLPLTQLRWQGMNATTTKLFVTSATSFSLISQDRSGTGATSWYRIDGGAAAPGPGPFSLFAEGDHTIAYWSVDNLGGTESPNVFAVFVDNSAPITHVSASNRSADHITIALDAADAGAGVAFTEYRIDNGSWTRYAAPFTVQGTGGHIVSFRSTDLLGHEEAEQSVSVTVAGAGPAISNFKPVLAAILAIVLLLAGFFLGRREKVWALRSPRVLGIAFAIVEISTGAASAATGALAVPPYAEGLAVDLALFVVGLASIFLLAREQRPPEQPAEPGTAK